MKILLSTLLAANLFVGCSQHKVDIFDPTQADCPKIYTNVEDMDAYTKREYTIKARAFVYYNKMRYMRHSFDIPLSVPKCYKTIYTSDIEDGDIRTYKTGIERRYIDSVINSFMHIAAKRIEQGISPIPFVDNHE